jgi:hypothetical protein
MTVPFCLFNQCSTSVKSLSLILDLTDEHQYLENNDYLFDVPNFSEWYQSVILF